MWPSIRGWDGTTTPCSGQWLYRFDITHRRTDVSPVAEHFTSRAHSESDMAVIVIELSTSRDQCLWKVKEGRWIRTLETCSLQEWISRFTDCETWPLHLSWHLGLLSFSAVCDIIISGRLIKIFTFDYLRTNKIFVCCAIIVSAWWKPI